VSDDGETCPSCGATAPWSRFVDLGRCPECSTNLQTLLDLGRHGGRA